MADNDMKGKFMTSMGRGPRDMKLSYKIQVQWKNVTRATSTAIKFQYTTIPLPVAGRLDASGIDLDGILFSGYAGFLGGDHLSFWNHNSAYSVHGIPAVVYTDTGSAKLIFTSYIIVLNHKVGNTLFPYRIWMSAMLIF